MRRFLLFLAAVLSALTVLAAPAAAAAAATSCVSASAATYRHSFTGAAGTVTITATRSLCSGQSQAFSLVSYTTGAPGSASGQFIYDSANATVSAAHRSVTLKVAVPGCYHQVDAFIGAGVRTETTSTAGPYGTAALGSATGTGSRSTGPLAWHTGGTTACSATPAVTLTNACDGTFTATLANGAGAGTPAVFLTGDRRVRLSPGRSATITVAKGRTLTVRDSSFTTHVASWRAPATSCDVAPPAGPAAPAVTATPVATAATAGPSASASASASAAAPAYTDAPAGYPQFPRATTAAAALAKTGRSTGSIIAIAAGLLMIGTGIAAITYLVRLNRAA